MVWMVINCLWFVGYLSLHLFSNFLTHTILFFPFPHLHLFSSAIPPFIPPSTSHFILSLAILSLLSPTSFLLSTSSHFSLSPPQYRPRKKSRLLSTCVLSSRSPSPGSSPSSRRKRRPAVKLLSSTRLRITVTSPKRSPPPTPKRKRGGKGRKGSSETSPPSGGSTGAAGGRSRRGRRRNDTKSKSKEDSEGTKPPCGTPRARRRRGGNRRGGSRGKRISKGFSTPPTPPSPSCPSPILFLDEDSDPPSPLPYSLLGPCSVLDTPTPSPEPARPLFTSRDSQDSLGDLAYLTDILKVRLIGFTWSSM